MIASLLLNQLFKASLSITQSSPRCCCNLTTAGYRQIASLKGKSELEHLSAVHVENFKSFLDCSYEEAVGMFKQNQLLSKCSLLELNKQIVTLHSKNISSRSIVLSPWLLNEPEEKLDELISIVQQLEPRDLNDLLPIASVSPNNLEKILKVFQEEKTVIAEGNRIYHFSKHLKVEPVLVARQFASHFFMFHTSWKNIKKSLEIMLEFNVDPRNILTGFWAFRYQPEHVKERLERASSAGRTDLRLWLVVCSEENLRKTLVGDDSSIVDYLSGRLGYDIETTIAIVEKYEPVKHCRVPRVEKILDYLMIEENFKPHEIANCINILMGSLNTIRSRISLLKKHGLRPNSLYMIRYSKQEFSKRLDKMIEEQQRAKSLKKRGRDS